MIYYQRFIGNKEINILIEDDLFFDNNFIFNYILTTFTKKEYSPVIFKNVIYIYYKQITDIAIYDYLIYCDVNNPQWILSLIGKLEEYYAAVLNCLIVHGSCLRIKDKNILIMGERKVGKTTLTSYLSLNKQSFYLDDDCVYFLNDKWFGFNMPISVRKKIDTLPCDNIICTAVDGEKIERTLYRAINTVSNVKNIDIILFPKFNDKKINNIYKVESGYLFNKIIKNVRNSKNMTTLFKDISKLARNTIAFNITYANSEEAWKLLDTIIDNRENTINENSFYNT